MFPRFRLRWLLAGLVSSCSPPARPATPMTPIPLAVEPPPAPRLTEPEPDHALDQLDASYRERFARRASLAVAGRLYFEVTGVPLVEAERAIDVPFELVVVAELERFVRVALADGPAVVLAFLPRSDLARRVARETRLVVDPTPKADRRVGVFLRPGATVEVLARTPRHFRARFRDSDLDCEGYLPKAALGEVYTPAPALLGVSELAMESQLLVEPGGRPLPCALTPGARLVSERTRSGDHSLVEYTSSHLRIAGWVRSAEVHNASPEGFVKLADVGAFTQGASELSAVVIQADVTLYSRSGQPVGRTLSAAELPLLARAKQRVELQLNLAPWGAVSVWVDAGDLASETPSPGAAGTE